MPIVNFHTIDGVQITGDWSMPQSATRVVLMLHMMPATHESFFALGQELNKQGVATLAIDLRGHGESTRRLHGSSLDREEEDYGIVLNYNNFEDLDHQKSRLDVDAALNFIKKNGFTEKEISLVGASIGANLALDALDRYTDLPNAVLLSPGLDYRGITTEKALKGLEGSQQVWIISSKDDTYSTESAQKLFQQDMNRVKLTILDGSDHGTNIFMTHHSVVKDICEFVKK